MVKKLLVLVIVFIMAGILPVMAEVDDGTPPWFKNNGDYSTWVEEGRVGPPPWAAARAHKNWERFSLSESESDDDNDLGYPPWFTESGEYDAWVKDGMEGPPPWAPDHARQNFEISPLNDDEDDDEDNGPPWFRKQEAVRDWNAAGQEGPPPWAGVRGRKNK